MKILVFLYSFVRILFLSLHYGILNFFRSMFTLSKKKYLLKKIKYVTISIILFLCNYIIVTGYSLASVFFFSERNDVVNLYTLIGFLVPQSILSILLFFSAVFLLVSVVDVFFTKEFSKLILIVVIVSLSLSMLSLYSVPLYIRPIIALTPVSNVIFFILLAGMLKKIYKSYTPGTKIEVLSVISLITYFISIVFSIETLNGFANISSGYYRACKFMHYLLSFISISIFYIIFYSWSRKIKEKVRIIVKTRESDIDRAIKLYLSKLSLIIGNGVKAIFINSIREFEQIKKKAIIYTNDYEIVNLSKRERVEFLSVLLRTSKKIIGPNGVEIILNLLKKDKGVSRLLKKAARIEELKDTASKFV